MLLPQYLLPPIYTFPVRRPISNQPPTPGPQSPIPRCGSWAMRGRTHRRSHLDHLLGPRGAGAPDGNLNALKSGDHAHPLTDRYIVDLAHELVKRPDQLET